GLGVPRAAVNPDECEQRREWKGCKRSSPERAAPSHFGDGYDNDNRDQHVDCILQHGLSVLREYWRSIADVQCQHRGARRTGRVAVAALVDRGHVILVEKIVAVEWQGRVPGDILAAHRLEDPVSLTAGRCVLRVLEGLLHSA